jgi:hypothetical protein
MQLSFTHHRGIAIIDEQFSQLDQVCGMTNSRDPLDEINSKFSSSPPVGEFRKTRNHRNVGCNEIRVMSFQES